MKNEWIRKGMTIVLAAVCAAAAVPVAAAEAPAVSAEVAAVSEEAPAAAAEVPAVSVEAPVAAVETPVVPEETSAAAEEVAAVSAETPAESEEMAAADMVTDVQPAEEPVPVAAETEQTGPAVSAESAEPAEVAAKAEEAAAAEDPAEAEEAEPEEELEQEPETVEKPVVSYQTHVQTFGWQDPVKDGEVSGTEGLSKRLEGIRISVSGVEDLGIEYHTHVQTYGWQDYVADGADAGTTGESKRLEAIQIRLTGSAASQYDVYYCVHVQSYGWLNWAKNDQMAGTAGYSKRLEGIRIMILPKGDPAPDPVAGAVASFISSDGSSNIGSHEYQVIYNTHVQTYGWQDWVGDGGLGGTSGESKRLEGMHILLNNPEVSGSIEYRTHVQGIGWQEWVKDGAMAGTSGQSRRLEALQIRLTGEMADKYDVWYRTHVQNFGWRGWAKNGEEAGSQGYSYRMEAIEVKLLPKGSEAPGSTADPFSVSTIWDKYPLATARLDQIGWDLRNAFVWSASMPYYRLPQDISYGSRFFATYGFENGRGDCYVMAACFYEMAMALGYDAHWMFGYVPMAAGGYGVHSWVEVVVNGVTYICDPDYTHESGGNGYMITYGSGGWGYYSITRMEP